MNIFATDSNPIIAARNLCDKHINKMIVESAQMLRMLSRLNAWQKTTVLAARRVSLALMVIRNILAHFGHTRLPTISSGYVLML